MSKEDVLLFGSYGMRGSGKSYYEKLKEKDKEIERLNNIIDEIDMMLKTLIMESDFSNHKLTAQIILMNLNELRGLNKGDAKGCK